MPSQFNSSIVRVDTGFAFACAVRIDHKFACWGIYTFNKAMGDIGPEAAGQLDRDDQDDASVNEYLEGDDMDE